jgi:hypothetical protein
MKQRTSIRGDHSGLEEGGKKRNGKQKEGERKRQERNKSPKDLAARTTLWLEMKKKNPPRFS